MSGPFGANLYSVGFGTSPSATLSTSVIQTRDPAATDIRSPSGFYPIGQNWVNTSDGSAFELVGYSSSNGSVQANWIGIGGGTGDLNSLSGDSGTAYPLAGNIQIAGGTGISTSAGGDVVTISLAGGGAAVDSLNVQYGTTPVVPNGSGQITFNGDFTNAASLPVQTNGTAPNTVSLLVQLSSASGSSSGANAGICSFDSSDFSVDANGYVAILPGSLISTGTWTPTLQFGGADTGNVYGANTCTYIAIGTPGTGTALIVATGTLTLTTKGSATGVATLNGLPFAAGGSSTTWVANMIPNVNITIPAGYCGLTGTLLSTRTYLALDNIPVSPNGGLTSMDDTNFSNGSDLSITISYQA